MGENRLQKLFWYLCNAFCSNDYSSCLLVVLFPREMGTMLLSPGAGSLLSRQNFVNLCLNPLSSCFALSLESSNILQW